MRDAADIRNTMRPRSIYPPQTPAQRQAKCRDIKRGTWYTCPAVPVEQTPPGPNLLGPPAARPTPAAREKTRSALPAPPAPPALPAPPVTAMQKSTSAAALALPDVDIPSDVLRLSLPPAVAARLRSLLARKEAGKTPVTAAELAEAQGLLDIAEFFVVQRLRHRLSA